MTEAWERQKGEPSKSYSWFKEYRNLGLKRTLEKVKYTLTNSDILEEKNIPTLSQLTTQSSKWNWVERCRLYDNHIDQKEREWNYELFKQGNAKFQEFFNDDFELLKEIQKELKENSNKNAPTTRANSFLNLNKSAEIIYRNFRLAHGQPTDIKDNNTQIQGSIETSTKENDNVIHMKDKELEELLTINDDLEKFTDEL
nr:hypothetical protein [Methanobrevibacter smithii]